MESLLIPAGLGYVIGLVLGLLGGGGSILTVPALVYVAGQTPQMAVTASLLIVGANSALGVLFHRAHGALNWRVALVFGGTGMVSAYLAAGLSALFSSTALLVMFALLMLVVGGVMLARPLAGLHPVADCDRHWPTVVAAGLAVGVLTGLLGVGGGFLIVPALVMLVGLPMHQAVGTSLIIIAMNSLAGLLGHLGESALDMPLIALFIVGGLAGTFSGARLAGQLRSSLLQKLFALLVIGLALALLADNLGKFG